LALHWLIAYILLVRNAGSGCKFWRIAQDVEAGSFCAHPRNGGWGLKSMALVMLEKTPYFMLRKNSPCENNQK